MGAAVYTGATCVLMERFEPVECLELVQRHRVTLFFVVPPVLLMLSNWPELSKYDVSSLRTTMVGAAPVAPELARRFKQLTGHTPIQHFIHLKMQHACRLLDTTHEPVKRIAAQVGYDDPHYFSRLFKRVLGVAPQQYRQHRVA